MAARIGGSYLRSARSARSRSPTARKYPAATPAGTSTFPSMMSGFSRRTIANVTTCSSNPGGTPSSNLCLNLRPASRIAARSLSSRYTTYSRNDRPPKAATYTTSTPTVSACHRHCARWYTGMSAVPSSPHPSHEYTALHSSSALPLRLGPVRRVRSGWASCHGRSRLRHDPPRPTRNSGCRSANHAATTPSRRVPASISSFGGCSHPLTLRQYRSNGDAYAEIPSTAAISDAVIPVRLNACHSGECGVRYPTSSPPVFTEAPFHDLPVDDPTPVQVVSTVRPPPETSLVSMV